MSKYPSSTMIDVDHDGTIIARFRYFYHAEAFIKMLAHPDNVQVFSLKLDKIEVTDHRANAIFTVKEILGS